MNDKLRGKELTEFVRAKINARIENPNDYDKEIDLAIKCLFDKNIKIIDTLDERQTSILRYRFGISDEGQLKTLEEIGQIFGITRSRIREIELKALRRLVSKIKDFKERLPIDNYISEKMQKLMFISHSYEIFEEYFQQLSKEEQEKYKIEKDKISELYNNNIEFPISKLDLSVRAYNCLRRAGVKSVTDLVSMKKEQINAIKNLGAYTYRELIDKMHSLGLDFADEVEHENHFEPNNETDLEMLCTHHIIDARTYNCLVSSDKKSIGDVLMMSKEELCTIRLGMKKRENLIEKMHSLGFKFKDELKEFVPSLTINDSLQSLIGRRNELLSKGKQLSSEKEALLQQERNLDINIKVVQEKENMQNGTKKK